MFRVGEMHLDNPLEDTRVNAPGQLISRRVLIKPLFDFGVHNEVVLEGSCAALRWIQINHLHTMGDGGAGRFDSAYSNFAGWRTVSSHHRAVRKVMDRVFTNIRQVLASPNIGYRVRYNRYPLDAQVSFASPAYSGTRMGVLSTK